MGYDCASLGDRHPIFRRIIFGHSDHSKWGNCVLSEVLCKVPKLAIQWRWVMYQKNRILNHTTVKNCRLASHSTVWHELLNFLFCVKLTRFDYRTVSKPKVSFNLKQTNRGNGRCFHWKPLLHTPNSTEFHAIFIKRILRKCTKRKNYIPYIKV